MAHYRRPKQLRLQRNADDRQFPPFWRQCTYIKTTFHQVLVTWRLCCVIQETRTHQDMR